MGKLPLVKVLPIVAALALVASGCGTGNGGGQSTPKPTVTVTVTAAASPAVTATLPVHVLKTSSSITPAPPLLYPVTVTVRLPSVWADKVAAYGVASVVLLAPTGWVEGYAGIGADGDRSAMLHATGASAVAGQLFYEDESMGMAFQDAAPYFPWLREEWDQNVYDPGSSSPPARPGLVEHFASDQLAEYHLTSGPQVTGGLQVNGVARTMMAPHDFGAAEFDRLEVALPPSDHVLATAILNDYLSPSTSVDSGVSSTLQSYIDAINSHDYRYYVSCFTSQQRHLFSASGFTKGFSTTHDGDVVIHSIRVVGSGKAVARVTFTSTQAASQGPNGDTRDNWKLDFTMKLVGWKWLIDSVTGPNASTLMPSASPVPAASPSSASAIIPWNQALQHVGDYETVQGPVVSTDFAQNDTGQPTFLNIGFKDPDPRRVSVVIWFEDRGNFPEAPEVMYRDKTIRVSGLIKNYQGSAQIKVTSPNDIEIVP